MEIAGKKVLQHIIDRLLTIVPRQHIILATSNLSSDDALENFAGDAGIASYRGSLEKVGERFYAAAQALNCDYALRINGDNVFLDPDTVQTIIDQASTGKYRFLSNVKGRTFPKGMSVEAVELDYYRQYLPQIKSDAYCNEHVMVCIYQDPAPADHLYLQNEKVPEAAGIQLALDTPEDLERTRWMLEHMSEGEYNLQKTFEYYCNYEKSISG